MISYKMIKEIERKQQNKKTAIVAIYFVLVFLAIGLLGNQERQSSAMSQAVAQVKNEQCLTVEQAQLRN